jgi:cell division control protein 7
MPAGSGLPPNDGYRIPDFIVRLNPGIYDVPEGHPDPKAYSKEVTAVIDLARVLLHPDCTRRWTARQALEHPFLAELPNEHLVIDT